jgi:hypothetical protein
MITGQQPQPAKRRPGSVRIFAARTRKTTQHRTPPPEWRSKITTSRYGNCRNRRPHHQSGLTPACQGLQA